MLMEGYENLELSTQLLIKEALSREIEVEVLDSEDNFIRLKKGDKIEYVKEATKTSADTYISQLIMANKEVTKVILRENGINVPNGTSVHSLQEAKEKWNEFLNKAIVIKPKSTNFGDGIIILQTNNSYEDFISAVEQGFNFDSTVLIEEFAHGKEYRFLVIKDEVVAILHRIPANVTGDGVLTIEELVIEKNKDPLRGTGHVTPFEKINIGQIETQFLGFQGKDISYIPMEGEKIYLRENSNISTGGDSIDFTDEIIDQYKTIAINSAKAVGAKICGADIIINNIYEEPNLKNHSVIELNFNPAIYTHKFPHIGRSRNAAKKVLDLLGFEEIS